MRLFRIAVLECDTPIDVIREHYGTYGNLVKLLMQNSLKTLSSADINVEPIFTSWDVVDAKQYPKLDDVDALFLSGSSMGNQN